MITFSLCYWREAELSEWFYLAWQICGALEMQCLRTMFDEMSCVVLRCWFPTHCEDHASLLSGDDSQLLFVHL